MLILMVEVEIKPDKREQFLASITENARSCERDEEGCLRFDILQDSENANKYFYYEVYRNDADVKAHFESPHFHKYRDAAKEFIEKQTPHRLNSIYPTDAAWGEPRG
jgi:autoinducer 2-degrading protein